MSVIAIARGTFSAAEKLSKYLADELDFRLITREEVYDAALKYGIKETGLGKISIVDERPPSVLHQFTEKRRQYLACFQTALMDFALNDNLIYVGHLAHLLLADYRPVLRIRLAASYKYRIHKLRDEQEISYEEAKKLIDDIDERRLQWSQFLYKVDWRDPVLYDLVINPEKFDLGSARDTILTCTKSLNLQPTARDIEVLRNLRLQSVVQLKIWSSSKTKDFKGNIQADAMAGEIRVYSKVPKLNSESWENDLRKVIRRVEEVKKIVITPSLTKVVK